MAFQNFSTVQPLVCPTCEGQGCGECGNFGVYGLSGDRTLIFTLPPFLDLKKRRQAKNLYLIKNGLLLVFGLILILVFWSIINSL